MDRAELLAVLAATLAIGVFAAYVLVAALLRRSGRVSAAREERMRTAEELVEQSARLVSMASHELRNPLSVLTLSAELMRMSAAERDDPELAEVSDNAVAAARRAEAVVGELLELSRLDAGALVVAPEPVAVAQIVDRAVESAQRHRPPHAVAIRGDIDAVALADGGHLTVILRNLVDNAFKYSPEGSTVSVDVSKSAQRVTFDVCDQGPGIPAQFRESVFGRFHRLQQTEHIGGVGIGLHLSRELARRMGGDLTVGESYDGACVRLHVPAVE